MVAVINVTPKEKLNGKVHDYEVRINRSVITGFQHVRSDGLAVCLEKAAVAVRKQKQEDDLRLIELLYDPSNG